MPIKRCPYCRAIIDDNVEFCTNCGTRLLFPEDEHVEEEIPGEKILDSDLEEDIEPDSESEDIPSDVSVDPPPFDDTGAEAELDTSEDFEPKEEGTSEEDEEVIEKEEPKEATPLDDSVHEALSPFGDPEQEEPSLNEISKEDFSEEEDISEEEEVELIDEPDRLEEEIALEESSAVPDETESDSGVLPEKLPDRESLPDTGTGMPVAEDEEESKSSENKIDIPPEVRQMSIFDPVEKEKEDIEKFLTSLKKERQGYRKPTDKDLPPWAAKIRDGSEEEESSREESKPAVSEPPLFEEVQAQEEEEQRISPAWTPPPDVEPEEEKVVRESSDRKKKFRIPFSGVGTWLQGRLLDVFFVTVIWLFCLWLGSRILDISLFRIISGSTGKILIFYGILLFEYFFLFFFFLGYTLGDRFLSSSE